MWHHCWLFKFNASHWILILILTFSRNKLKCYWSLIYPLFSSLSLWPPPRTLTPHLLCGWNDLELCPAPFFWVEGHKCVAARRSYHGGDGPPGFMQARQALFSLRKQFLVNPTFSRPTPRLSSVHTLSAVHRMPVCMRILYTHTLHLPMFLLVASNSMCKICFISQHSCFYLINAKKTLFHFCTYILHKNILKINA